VVVAVYYALLLAQESDPSNPLVWLPALGPFAATAAVWWLWTRDLRDQRDHYRGQIEARAVVDAEIAATLRNAVHTIETNTAAIRAFETRLRAVERAVGTRSR
jgi:hypothetical protein